MADLVHIPDLPDAYTYLLQKLLPAFLWLSEEKDLQSLHLPHHQEQLHDAYLLSQNQLTDPLPLILLHDGHKIRMPAKYQKYLAPDKKSEALAHYKDHPSSSLSFRPNQLLEASPRFSGKMYSQAKEGSEWTALSDTVYTPSSYLTDAALSHAPSLIRRDKLP